MSQHPFENFKQVLNAQQLIDIAFSKASKRPPKLPKTLPNIEKVKRKEIKRIENAGKILVDKITTIIESVPNLDLLPGFYRRLSHLIVDNDELRQNLGRINGITPVIKRLIGQYRRKIGDQPNAKQCTNVRAQFFARAASVMKKVNSSLVFLDECQQKLKKIPILNLEMPCVVVAGYPNVGKSTIVGEISSAKPTVSEYPFTTKEIFIGMYKDDLGARYFQVIDTPGILDRPMEARNDIEKQAILALNLVATIVLFVFDPTPACGYTLDHQINLYSEIKTHFLEGMDIPIKIILNKSDFASEQEITTLLERLQIESSEVIITDAKSGANMDKVTSYLLEFFKDRNYQR